ncbi:T9SS type A sorting domain-containing protein [Psychroserpens sp. AS72]|uniref:T9SS type A sorting domain-containing protein n=1 Tax=Psychroserpens sp. AS72 TaxID=3135775 RepID=UPI0031707B7B
MKKVIFFIFVIITISANSQIINFDDPNFKDLLLTTDIEDSIAMNSDNIAIIIDTNGDGEIEVSEAALVDELFIPINSNISSLVGVEFFTNLTQLSCLYNELTQLDVSTLNNLNSLALQHNQLLQLDVSMLENLTYLSVFDNQLTTLNINPQLEYLNCNDNNIDSIDFIQSSSLTELFCTNNNLSELNLSNAISLRNLNCDDNQLTQLLIQNLPLIGLSCDNNLLTSIDVSGVGLINPGLILFINCENNLLTTIDVTVATNPKVRLECSNNPNLTTLYVKNGEIFDDTFNPMIPPRPSLFFENNTNLELICADDFNFEYLEDKILDYNLTGITLTSDCTLDVIDYKKSNFTFYPNPVDNSITIDCLTAFNVLKVYDITGRQVHQTNFETLTPINLEFLNSGHYIIQLHSKTEKHNFLIIKE